MCVVYSPGRRRWSRRKRVCDAFFVKRAGRKLTKASAYQRFSAATRSGMASRDEIRAGLSQDLARLWRYGLALSGSRDVAEDLVQATCLRALERAEQFQSGTRLDRWLFAILRSIWLNEVRARRVREGKGFVDPEQVLFTDGAEIETNIFVGQVLTAVHRLPEAQRETVLLVYVEGLSYSEAADLLGTPIGTIMSRLAAARLALARLRSQRGATMASAPREQAK
jgi:RNA polymerase sigma-70 factor, ECF subfamily